MKDFSVLFITKLYLSKLRRLKIAYSELCSQRTTTNMWSYASFFMNTLYYVQLVFISSVLVFC